MQRHGLSLAARVWVAPCVVGLFFAYLGVELTVLTGNPVC
jgi:hypothetical protein